MTIWGCLWLVQHARLGLVSEALTQILDFRPIKLQMIPRLRKHCENS